MTDLLYADDLVLCGESEEDLKAIVGRFIEVCRKIGLKVSAGKRKVIVKWREGIRGGGLCKWIRLEHVSEFKYL